MPNLIRKGEPTHMSNSKDFEHNSVSKRQNSWPPRNLISPNVLNLRQPHVYKLQVSQNRTVTSYVYDILVLSF